MVRKYLWQDYNKKLVVSNNSKKFELNLAQQNWNIILEIWNLAHVSHLFVLMTIKVNLES